MAKIYKNLGVAISSCGCSRNSCAGHVIVLIACNLMKSLIDCYNLLCAHTDNLGVECRVT